MVRTLLLALLLAAVCGCSHVDNAATEGKNAFDTGMRTSEKARQFGAEKESHDKQADEF